MKKWWSFLFLAGTLSCAQANLRILAAENFYGDIAQTIGGSFVTVTSVMTSPSSDPHFFNAPANLEQLVDQADIIIENGAGYDSWMDVLYAKSNHKAILLNVASITHTGSNFNPHIWYNPVTIPTFVPILAYQMSQLDSANQTTYQQNAQGLIQMGQLYQLQVQKIAKQLGGAPVTATEPVCDALLTALNLPIKNKEFQTTLMNEGHLTPDSIDIFENSLTHHEVNLLVYNNQVTDKTTAQLKQLAIQSHIPVVGVEELMPEGQHYYAWMYQTLYNIRDALAQNSSSS